MNRWLALLLALIGGAVAAYFAVLFAAGALIGLLWLYVFGDDPWPGWTDSVLGPALMLFGAILWAWFARLIWARLRPAR